MPAFRCASCSRTFNRLTGTPLARLRHADTLYAFVKLLSFQMSYMEAGEILQVDYSAIANWAEKLRAWLLQLDPTGAWESRVLAESKDGVTIQAGNQTAPGRRLFPMRQRRRHPGFFGFADDGRTRRLTCLACRITFQAPKRQHGPL
jgi:hypothetical protein